MILIFRRYPEVVAFVYLHMLGILFLVKLSFNTELSYQILISGMEDILCYLVHPYIILFKLLFTSHNSVTAGGS